MRKIKSIFKLFVLVLFIGIFALSLNGCKSPDEPAIDDPVVEPSNKKKPDVSKVRFPSGNYVWEEGETYKVTVSNVPKGVTVVYENNTLDKAGKVEAVAKLYDSENELLSTITTTLTVRYKTFHDEEIFTSLDCIYTGEEFSIKLNPEEESKFKKVEYFDNAATECGTYFARALVTTNTDYMYEYRAILNIEHPFNQEFRDYTDEMFVYFLEGDQSTLNIFMIDYEAYGFEHQDATWYKYEEYSEEDHQNDLEEIEKLKEDFAKYNRDELNSYQKVDYDKIKDEIDYLDFMINNTEYILMRQTYVDQFGGYAADIPTTMEAYQVRTRQDIEDIISYIDSIDDAFDTYDDYVLARAEAGYPLTNFTINKMVDYLDGVSKRNGGGKDIKPLDGEDEEDDPNAPYYLIAVLEKKITDSKEALELTDDEINDYITRLNNAFVDFIQAHIDLANDLEQKCLNLANDDQAFYLSSYGEKGKILYEVLLRNRLGITMPMDEYIKFVQDTVDKYLKSYTSTGYSEAITNIVDGKVQVLDTDDPNEIIEFLRDEFAKTIIPDLKYTPQISVTYMDKTTTANTTTLAYYMKSALDSNDKEFIHLNGDKLKDDYLETIKTLAHEGYPGHLYAYVYSKENENLSNFVRVSTNTGHGEGWAKYVECALCDYLGQMKKGDWQGAMKKSKFWDLFIYQIYTRIDVGLGYEGWDVDITYNYLKNIGLNVTRTSTLDIIKDLVEMPGQYAAYGYGQALFYELHSEAKNLLGDNYDEIEFNEMLLSHGWIALSDLQELYNNYMQQKCFLNGIEFNK